MRFIAVAAILYSAGWIPMFFFRVESARESLAEYLGSERLWVQLTPVILTVHVAACCVVLSTVARLPIVPAFGALTLGVTALGFWFWGRWLIGPLRQTRLPSEPPLQFHRRGAFGIVRHPLYSSYVLYAAAPLVVVPRWYLFLTFAACTVAIAKRALQEEERLHQQLGPAYADYCRDVKRLVPYVW